MNFKIQGNAPNGDIAIPLFYTDLQIPNIKRDITSIATILILWAALCCPIYSGLCYPKAAHLSPELEQNKQ